ncbi:prepilin peptidase [Gluconacetobacter sp. 1c LMG 22058]|uniref:Prepilin peptidase n=1 Tax=Gluconacetobacter dulcium TaxID=2729096 RepID=A0A7W4PI69_9PROT|nr:A24 family peptidase [Gluconacetobacter dulcium]MBB2198967.1 prepilin peptidase [Gluconacetobacter dulcium]
MKVCAIAGMTGWPLGVACLGGVTVLLFWAALYDIATRRVSDRLVLCVALLDFLLACLGSYPWRGVLSGFCLFVLGVICWSRGWMGGGDAKLLGAVGLALRPGQVPALVLNIALVGGVLALGYLLARAALPLRHGRAAPRNRVQRILRIERWRLHRGCPLPYVCAITGGSLIVFL